MNRFCVLIYPEFSLQEITCLTSVLSVWFGEKIDFIASENKERKARDFVDYIKAGGCKEKQIINIWAKILYLQA